MQEDLCLKNKSAGREWFIAYPQILAHEEKNKHKQ